jgi:anti-anti-sigma factor
MTDLARVDIERRQDSIVAHLQGEVDASNAHLLEREIRAAVPNTSAGLILDLSEVEYMDSSGVRMLFTIHNQLRERGKRMRAVVPDTAAIKGVLEILGVRTLIPLDAEVSAAVAELAQ